MLQLLSASNERMVFVHYVQCTSCAVYFQVQAVFLLLYVSLRTIFEMHFSRIVLLHIQFSFYS
jgi:hypothetical protein